jgi:hypothetical protein
MTTAIAIVPSPAVCLDLVDMDLLALRSNCKPSRSYSMDSTVSTSTCSTETSLWSSNSTYSRCGVHFAPTPPEVICYQAPPLSATEKAALWYTRHDIKTFAAEEQERVHDYVQAHPQYVTQLVQIWSCPVSVHQLPSTKGQQLVKPLVESPLRGLEKQSLQGVMRQRRHVVLHKVLQAQHDLTVDPFHCYMSNDEKMEWLRQQCEPLSRTSNRFAKALAQADALAAAAS